MQKARQDAKEQWEAFKKGLEKKLISSLSAQEIASRSETAPCNCAFGIQDIQIEAPDGHPDYGITFLSSEECDPGCYYYSSEYYSSGEFCGTIINPACFDNWTGQPLPPEGLRHFNCQVPAYSAFPAYAAFQWVDEDCVSAGNLLDWSITFRVYCQESEANPNCGLGGGYGFVSDPITFSYPGTNDLGYYQIAAIQLTECGCKPVLAH